MLQLLQIADLHIAAASSSTQLVRMLDSLAEAAATALDPQQPLVCCLLGDLVDKGDTSQFARAEQLLTRLRKNLAPFQPSFEFVPGNHDFCGCPYTPQPLVCTRAACSLSAFDSLSAAFTSHPYSFDASSCITRCYQGVRLVLLDTQFHRSCRSGRIDEAALANLPADLPLLLLGHHPLYPEAGANDSCVENTAALPAALLDKQVLAYLHGHARGYLRHELPGVAPILGLAPTLQEAPGLSNQFNLITIQSGALAACRNFTYDKAANVWQPLLVR